MANPHVGEVWESDAALVSVRLVNTTDKRLHLSHIGGNCNCTRVAPSSAVIPPLGEVEVSLTYDLTERIPPEFGKLSREFQIVLSVEVGGFPQKPFVLTGTCRSHIATDTTVLHFGESNVRGREPVSRWLTVAADSDTANIRVVVADPTLQVGTVERRGGNWRVRLTPDHAHIQGRFDTTVRIEALNGAGEPIGVARVAVDGVVRDSATHSGESDHAP